MHVIHKCEGTWTMKGAGQGAREKNGEQEKYNPFLTLLTLLPEGPSIERVN